MKINISVLTDAQKEKRNQERKYVHFLKIGMSLVIALALLNVIFFLMLVVLNIEYRAAKKSSEYSVEKSASHGDDSMKTFQEVGSQVATLAKIKSEIPHWARVLVKISQTCPAEIRITKATAQQNHLKISGFAKTREAYLEFQERLRQENFQSPSDVANLVTSRDFNFELDITMPAQYLYQE